MVKIKGVIKNFLYGLNIICKVSPIIFFIKVLLLLLSSAEVYVQIWLWKNLINNLVYYSTQGSSVTNDIIIISVMYFLLLLINRLLGLANQILSYKYNDAIGFYLDDMLIGRISNVDIAFFDSSDSLDKLEKAKNILGSTTNLVWILFEIIKGGVQLIVSSILVSSLSLWIIPCTILLSIPSIINNVKIRRNEYEFNNKNFILFRKMDYYQELFFGTSKQEIRLYDLKDYFKGLYENEWNIWTKARNKKNANNMRTSILTQIIMTFNDVIIYIMAIFKLINNTIMVGDVTYYLSLMGNFRGNFISFLDSISSFIQSSNEVDDVREFLEFQPIIEKSGELIPNIFPKIEFKNVSFHYPNTDNYILQNCSFVIEPHKIVGLVGLNGSGKTTIFKLLLRLYEPCDGLILFDDIDYRKYDIVKLRSLFGVLFQDYISYSFTVRDNISMSNRDMVNNDDKIIDVCNISNSEFVFSWENGIDQMLTRRFDWNGKELSGGQWQRLAIARAFFRNAPVVLLDEPSAALDPVAEHDIFQKFAQISTDRSAVLISHRLSSITLADKIMVLENGQIVEQGSHAELLARNGRYAYLFNLQASKYMN